MGKCFKNILLASLIKLNASYTSYDLDDNNLYRNMPICTDSYLCASYVDWAPWIQPRGFQCPTALQRGPLHQSHSSGAGGFGQVWSHVALGCFRKERNCFEPTSFLTLFIQQHLLLNGFYPRLELYK